MLALTLEQAKAAGIGVILVLLAGAVASAWLLKKLVQKALLAVVLIGLAVVVWTQRTSLEDCADRVQDEGRAAMCTFFGRDVSIN